MKILSAMPRDFTKPNYRSDIDGLRAVAVLSVVGFHAYPDLIKGGFIGVDVFFVISGYLISTIIIQNIRNNQFSFIEFYKRRVRRIFPALLFVLSFCFALGWVTLFIDEFIQLGKHIAGGAGFVSNFVLWSESGYFDNDADTKPLLHLWSLGIEEQFYIVWPLLLWWIYKKNINIFKTICVIALLSFSINIGVGKREIVAAFYSPFTRVWELLIGSILAYLSLQIPAKAHASKVNPDKWFKSLNFILDPDINNSGYPNILAFIGCMLLIIGFFFITEESFFPGWLALLPTVGTLLLLAAGPNSWINRKILSNRLIVFIGLISYPLYLWHWPLLSFTRIIQSGQTTLESRSIAVAISFLLAWLTWKFIERPLRFGNKGNKKAVWLCSLMLVVGLAGVSCYPLEGFPSRKVVKINPHKSTGWGGGIAKKFLVNECGINEQKDKELFAFCVQDTRQIPKYALLGDSKAAALYAGLFRTSTEEGRWVFIGGNGPHGAPVPVLSDLSVYQQYQKLAPIAIDALSNQGNIETVVLVTAARVLLNMGNDKSIKRLPESKHYQDAFDGLENTIKKFIEARKKVVLLVDNPTLPDPKDCMRRKTSSAIVNNVFMTKQNKDCTIDLSLHLEYSQKYRDLLYELSSLYDGKVKVFDTLEILCDTEKGVCQSYKDNHILYNYTDHISDYAAGLIGEKLNRNILR